MTTTNEQRMRGITQAGLDARKAVESFLASNRLGACWIATK